VSEYHTQPRRRSAYDDEPVVVQARPRRSGQGRRRPPRPPYRQPLLLVSVFGTVAVVALLAALLATRSPGTSSLGANSLGTPTLGTPTLGTPTLGASSLGTSSPGASSPGATAPRAHHSALISAGDSKANCISPNAPGGVLTRSVLDDASSVTGLTYDCLSVFDNSVPTWASWEDPWMFHITDDGWDAWLTESSEHQIVLSQDLIPKSVSNNSNPLTWEKPCASGDYDQYATGLAQNLVSYGAGNTVIRLGTEANGSWEADSLGGTSAEMSDWAKCYANEVTAMRAVPGSHFLFVWNPNACTHDNPLSAWYPGNSYVDIIGADNYDQDCRTLQTVAQEGWKTYSTDSTFDGAGDPDFPSLVNIEAFAVGHGKPMSFPEWGLPTGDDDPAYVTGLAGMFNSEDFAYESYFDNNDDGIVPFGKSMPKATAAYASAFK